MPFYEIVDESATRWCEDDEHGEREEWSGDFSDDLADLYLRAEEAWPNGAALRRALAGGDLVSLCRDEDEAGAFDD